MRTFVKSHRRGKTLIKAHSRKNTVLAGAVREYLKKSKKYYAAARASDINPRGLQGSVTKAHTKVEKLWKASYPNRHTTELWFRIGKKKR